MGFLNDVFTPRNKPPQDVPKINIEGATEVPASQAAEPEVSPIAEKTDTPSNRWSLQRPLELFRKAKSSPNSEAPDAPAPAASKAAEVNVKRAFQSSADRQAKESALVLRSLIVGQNAGDDSAAPQARVSPAQLNSVKAQLLKPKTANQVIAQLRALPALADSASQTSTPIRAVCLPYTDEEAAEKHFSQLREVEHTKERTKEIKFRLPTIASATVESIAEAFRDLHVVSLFTAPDLGLGEPGDGPGLLAGAVPTAETVINGIVRVTPQLMALGYATGKTVIPDHTGIHPPVDRMSVLTYWWGLELLLPPPTLAYLSRAQSISNTVMNFLTAMSLMNEGVREIIPFVRYFSQYIDYEWSSIKAQDRGKGVICAATWIMPAALVPRPWDFPDPPKGEKPLTQSAPSDAKASATAAAPTPTASGEKAAPTLPSSPPEAASGSAPEAVSRSPPSPAPAAHDSVPVIAISAPGSA